jgi:glycosyltransferase involved in cell wall biosynthesis
MNSIIITVLMPVYNGEKYLSEAIESILNQTYKSFEFLIINDGSTDKSEEIILSYNDSRIKLVTQENRGISNALNTGLKYASGKYIVRMDADDISHPERIEKQYTFMKNNPEYILLGSDVNYMTENLDFIFHYSAPEYEHNKIEKMVRRYCPFIHSSVIYQKDIVLEIGGYSESAYAFEDHFLWSKIINKGKTGNLRDTLVDVRLNVSSVSIDFKDYDKKYLETKEKVLRLGKITVSDADILQNSFKKIDKKLKELSYHRLLAKKYLWNNYNKIKALENIKIANKIKPFSFRTCVLFITSFFPEKMIHFIYQIKKSF